MVEEHVFDLLPGYALGCLDDDELIQVARHLPHCALCRGEMEAYWLTVDQLALAGPVRVPPAQVKDRLMARIAGQAQRSAVQPARPTRTGFFHQLQQIISGSRRPAFSWSAAIAILLVIVLGTSNFLLWRQVTDLQARVPSGDVMLVRLDGTPDAPYAQGYLMVFENEGYGTLVVEDAPTLETGYQYQLWLIRDGKRTSGGVFSVNEHGYGTLEINTNQPLNTYPSFGVTVEPAGGSPGPTGQKVLGGDL